MNHPVYCIKQLTEKTSTDSRQLFLLDPQHICILGLNRSTSRNVLNVFNTRQWTSSERWYLELPAKVCVTLAIVFLR